MRRLVTSVIFGLVSINTLLQADTTRPKLVVGIVVDQLRTDYLEYLRSLFGQKGFNRLMKNGAYFKDVDFKETVEDPVAATAVIYTGAWPAYTGVPSAEIFDETLKKNIAALTDDNGSQKSKDGKLSPKGVVLSTISDELAIDGNGLGKIYSVAADGQQAVIMSSHAGTSAVWIDDNSGKWVTSPHYTYVPEAISSINRTSPLSQRIGSLQWKPAMNLAVYPGLPGQKKQFDFNYTFPTADRNVYKKFKSSALSNSEVTDAAIAGLNGMSLGKNGDAIDMLNVAYTAAPFKYADTEDYRLELEDTYIRLDSQLARLLDEIDSRVGLENTYIFLSSTGYYDDAAADDVKYGIPTGEFSLKRAESLLNSYLSATYGNGDYVSRIAAGKLYLDKKTIEKKGLSLAVIRDEARSFLGRMSGISKVYTIEEIQYGTGNRDIESLALSVDPKSAADLYLAFTPGWEIIDDTVFPEQSKIIRLGSPLTPAFLLYPAILPREINARVDATSLAPTISSNLHIRSPNGASEKPVALE